MSQRLLGVSTVTITSRWRGDDPIVMRHVRHGQELAFLLDLLSSGVNGSDVDEAIDRGTLAHPLRDPFPSWGKAAIAPLVNSHRLTMPTLAANVDYYQGQYPYLVQSITQTPNYMIPIIDLAVGDYFVWALGWQVGPVGFGGSLAGTVPGLVLAHTVLAFPFPFLTVSTSLTTVDRTLELAAAGLGANPWKTFQKITLPLIRTGVITGAIFACLTSWDEVVVASFLASPRVSTVPVQIFTELRQSYDPAAAAISSVLLAAAVVLVGLLALIPLLARRAYGRSTDNLAEIVSGERGVIAATS